MKRKILVIVISAVLLIGLIPANAFAYNPNDTGIPALKESISQAMKKGNASLDIQKYNISTDDIELLAQDVRDSYPELFYADISTYTYVGTKVYALRFTYNALNTKEDKDKYEAAVKEALKSVNEKMTNLEKALALHDYLTKNTKFDTNDGIYAHNAYGALVLKNAVCDGYSKAYQELLRRCGIDSLIIRSVPMEHAWNQINIGGSWFNVDVTWDDPSPDIANHTEYTYFMFSDTAFQKRGHTSWTSYVECKDTKYDNARNWTSMAKNLPVQSATFKDIYSTDYYYNAVDWAYKNGVTNGISDTLFGAASTCTRAQAVTFLWRAMGEPEPNTTGTNPFSDVSENAYYYKAVIWAVERGITTGTGTNTFSPNAKCQYAHIITFLWRAKGSPISNSSFASQYEGQYYQTAASWGYNKSMFKNSGNVFTPENDCPRSDIVYYIYLSR